MQTIGRNDPCPCGSGRKFKHCCERSGIQDPGSSQPDWLTAFKEQISTGDMGSIEELQEEADQFFESRNRAPVSDFHGLSSEQMADLLHFSFDSPRVVEFADRLASPPDAPFNRLFGMIAEAITTDGLKPTATGSLPRQICKDIARLYWNEETFPCERLFGSVNKEMDFFDLHIVRVVSELAGFVRKYKGRFILGRDCRARLESGGQAALYPTLLKVYATKFNWGYRDGFPKIVFIQRSFLFTLFLLTKYGHEWRPHLFYEDQFLRAFPAVLSDVPEESYTTPERTARSCYTHRTLLNFAGFLGLAEIEDLGYRDNRNQYRIRSTPLLSEALTFHV